jgi:hypothetical protein
VERYFRDAPLMIVGEGTNELQRNIIARQLIQPAGKNRRVKTPRVKTQSRVASASPEE